MSEVTKDVKSKKQEDNNPKQTSFCFKEQTSLKELFVNSTLDKQENKTSKILSYETKSVDLNDPFFNSGVFY